MIGRLRVANRRPTGGWWWRVPVCLLVWLVWAAPLGGLLVATLWLRGIASQLPQTPNLAQWTATVPQSSRIVARDGTVLAELPFDMNGEIGFRDLVRYSDIPLNLVQALLAAEDQRFWTHRGADYAAIARAALSNFQEERVVSGASTITQQVARNLLPEIGNERNFTRKVKEILLARNMERVWSKRAIFEVYCNYVFLGARSYGVVAAARTYFDKSLVDLDVHEAALLAGLVQAPSRLDPTKNPAEALARRNEVLRRMSVLGSLPEDAQTSPEADALTAWQQKPLGLVLRPRPSGAAAPWSTEIARKLLMARFPGAMASGGLVAVISVLPSREQAAQRVLTAFASGLRDPRQPEMPLPQAAALAWDLRSGYVEVQLGGTDFSSSEFDRTTMACRQPGSAWKAVTYAAAIERGVITPATPLRDAPITSYDEGDNQMWKPASGKHYRGVAIARDAFAWSLNAPAIDVFDQVGATAIIEYARHWGITTSISPLRPMALGASCVRMNELLGVYASIATDGTTFSPQLLIDVRQHGELLRDVRVAIDPWVSASRRLDALARGASPARARAGVDEREVLMSPQTAFLMRSLMLAVTAHGTAAAVSHQGVAFAGKTGTTNNNTDAWFLGFGEHEASAVWLGYDDAAQTMAPDHDGSRAAVPLWLRLAKLGPPSLSERNILGHPPTGITAYRIDPETGLLAGNGVIGRDVWLRADTAPTETSDGISHLGIDASRTSTEF